MERTERAVVRLSQAHTEMTEAGPVEWPPLLAWLERSVTEVMGRTGEGSGGGGVPFNEEAADLLDRIDSRLGLLEEAMGVAGPRRRGLVERVPVAWERAKRERVSGRVADGAWARICDEFPAWVARIEAQDDRPRKIELTVACPECGQRWVNQGGERRAAVRIEFAEGAAPAAECADPECGAAWVGWRSMRALGATVGARADRAVLLACGIDFGQGLQSVGDVLP